MLTVSDLKVDIKGSRILNGISLTAEAGELVCLVGRNGAGKTTTFRTIMGYLKPVSGEIRLGDRSIVGTKTHRIAQMGVGYAPEESQVFGDLTVADNIELPTWTRASERDAKTRIGLAYEVFPKLRQYEHRGGAQLSGGERKMLSIARALALDAQLLLLDEPFEGLAPTVIEQLFESFDKLRREVSIIIVDHHLDLALALSDRTVALERGRVIHTGPSKDLRDDLALRRKVLWL